MQSAADTGVARKRLTEYINAREEIFARVLAPEEQDAPLTAVPALAHGEMRDGREQGCDRALPLPRVPEIQYPDIGGVHGARTVAPGVKHRVRQCRIPREEHPPVPEAGEGRVRHGVGRRTRIAGICPADVGMRRVGAETVGFQPHPHGNQFPRQIFSALAPQNNAGHEPAALLREVPPARRGDGGTVHRDGHEFHNRVEERERAELHRVSRDIALGRRGQRIVPGGDRDRLPVTARLAVAYDTAERRRAERLLPHGAEPRTEDKLRQRTVLECVKPDLGHAVR